MTVSGIGPGRSAVYRLPELVIYGIFKKKSNCSKRYIMFLSFMINLYLNSLTFPLKFGIRYFIQGFKQCNRKFFFIFNDV